jgi:hypothetical protein
MGPQLPWLSRSHLGSPCLTGRPGSASEAGVWVAVTKVVSTAGKCSNRHGSAGIQVHV